MKIRHYLVVLGALLLAGCNQPAANAESRGGGGTCATGVQPGGVWSDAGDHRWH